MPDADAPAPADTPAPDDSLPRLALRSLAGAVRRWLDEDCGQRAASIAYYALLSFFPFIILLAAVASLFVGDDAEEIRQALQPLRPMLPQLREGFWDRVQELVEKRGVLSLFSLLLLVFLSTRVTIAVQRAFRPIFRDGDHRPRRRLRGTRWMFAHGLTIAALLSIGLILTGIAVLELVMRQPLTPEWMREAAASSFVTRHALPMGILAALAYAVFALLPDVSLRKRWCVAGAVFFAVSHDLVITAWARLTGQLASGDVVYGSFVGAVSFAAWTWAAASLLLLSAALVAELSAREARTSGLPPSRVTPSEDRQ